MRKQCVPGPFLFSSQKGPGYEAKGHPAQLTATALDTLDADSEISLVLVWHHEF